MKGSQVAVLAGVGLLAYSVFKNAQASPMPSTGQGQGQNTNQGGAGFVDPSTGRQIRYSPNYFPVNYGYQNYGAQRMPTNPLMNLINYIGNWAGGSSGGGQSYDPQYVTVTPQQFAVYHYGYQYGNTPLIA